jgi:antitoxin component of MazEF toxin-antitoxin module
MQPKGSAMTHILVGRWGKNLAVRFPAEIASAVGIREGERVEMDIEGGVIVIRRSAPLFTLDEMFRGHGPAEWRAAYADAYDWGPDIGREAIEE